MNTLKTVYCVPMERNLYIHGESANEEEDLVLGHAWSPGDRAPLNVDDGPDQDHRISEGYEILDEYFAHTFKSSRKIIEANSKFFEGLG
ncbi:hypothetical protein E8E95_14710 [Pseudomonas sp. BN414]|nr:hypothetical protein [Pseudomonas sp. BN414]